MPTAPNRTIRYFLLVWLIVNVVQAAFSELHYDESYYWVFSKFLDWGYYDHPPMVALFIKVGTFFTQSTLGVRMMSIVSNVAAIAILWRIAKEYADNPKLFVLLYAGMLILHVYSFITTPDTPLFFFTVLFYYYLRRYISEDRWSYAIILGIIAACMLYSKYHAILVFLFSILAYWPLLKRPSFWLIAGLASVLLLPHILWQIGNGYPSVEYHLFDRTARTYRLSFTTDFLLSQVLIIGPLTGVFLYYYVYKQRASDIFLRILKANAFGFLVFFLLTTFKSRVEAHWTLLAFIPFVILAYVYLSRMPPLPRWLLRLFYANIALIALIRVVFVFPIPGLLQIKGLKQFWGKERFAEQVHAAVGDSWFIMDNGFQDISNYNFVNNTTKGFSYNTRDYRKTQYDYWPIEDSLRNHAAYYASFNRQAISEPDSIPTDRGTLYLTRLDSVRTYQKVNISVSDLEESMPSGSHQRITLEFHNPYPDTITFGKAANRWDCFIEYGFSQRIFEHVEFREITGDYHQLRIAPNASAKLATTVVMPKDPGEYMLMFSIRTAPFAGSRNSKKIPITITPH